MRQELAKLEDFEPYTAFTRIDRESKGYITAEDLKKYIK